MKQWITILLSILLCLSLASCQRGLSAEEVGLAMCKLYVHGDTEVASMLSDWDVAAVRDHMEQDFYHQLYSNLEASGIEDPDETALNEVISALMDARKRIPLKVETVETEKDRVTLQITVGSLDIGEIDTTAAQRALEEIKGRSDLSKEDLDDLMQAYTEALKAEFDASDPTVVQTSFTVRFIENEGVWLPEEMNRFIEQLGQHIRR